MSKKAFENYVHPKDETFVFTFGKHKGKSINKIMTVNPAYLIWAHNNIEWFKLTEYLLKNALDKQLELDDFEWNGDDVMDDCAGMSMWDFI